MQGAIRYIRRITASWSQSSEVGEALFDFTLQQGSCADDKISSGGYRMSVLRTGILTLGIFALGFSSAWGDDEPATVSREELIPDLRDDDSDLTVQSGNLVVVPIPMSGPTLETGLILGEMYFHGQTEEQAKKQPASVTGGAGMYTSSDSKAAALVHQGYWKEDTWRWIICLV